ncbi:MAG: PAS domain-containing protein, partial [Burkholderiales bacterium]|nr:PAS domain-containing protein [Burkholderiales bacterium]
MNTTMTDAARRHRAVTVNLVSRGTALALLACGMVAFLGVWLLEARGGVLRPIDRFGYPAASLGMAAMVVALTLRRVSVAASLRGACVVVCTYFVLSVGMAAYIDPASAVSLYDVGTISPWLLMLEVLLYATFPVRTATGLAVATLSLVMTPLWFSNKGATVDELLLNNALANIICIAIMQALARQWAALVRATPRERLPDADANADVEITAAELARRRAADLARLLDEARQAGQDARTVAAELRTMLETFPGFVGRLDAAGRYTYVNPPLAAMFGRTPADIVGRQPRTLPGVRRITESVERA